MLAFIDLYLLLMSVHPYQSALKGHSDLGLHYNSLFAKKIKIAVAVTDNFVWQLTTRYCFKEHNGLCNMLFYKYRLDCQVLHI